MVIDPNLIEHVAKTLCEASNEQWRTGIWQALSGTDTINNKMIWEDHDLDAQNNHWRYKAEKVIKAIKEFENGTSS